jgi:hypothetical protein
VLVQDAYSVVFATYSVKVDTIAGVRVPRVEMDAIWRSLAASFAAGSEQVQPVISVIAFRGENRSEPQYIRSNSSQLTEGTGIVKDLSLMVSWDRGNFAGFTWYNTGPCDACGGLSSSSCVQTMYDPDFQQYTESACACEQAAGLSATSQVAFAGPARQTACSAAVAWLGALHSSGWSGSEAAGHATSSLIINQSLRPLRLHTWSCRVL